MFISFFETDPGTVTQNELPGCSCNESYCNNNNSFPLLVVIIPSNIISAIVSAILTAVIMRLFCEVKYKKVINRTKHYSPNNSPHHRSVQNVTGPLYDEVQLTDKDNPMNLSQNVAYQSTSK